MVLGSQGREKLARIFNLGLKTNRGEEQVWRDGTRNPGKVFTRPELLDRVRGYDRDGYEDTVNSHINRLRSKIKADSGSPSPITTIWGVGYKFEAQLARQFCSTKQSGSPFKVIGQKISRESICWDLWRRKQVLACGIARGLLPALPNGDN